MATLMKQCHVFVHLCADIVIDRAKQLVTTQNKNKKMDPIQTASNYTFQATMTSDLLDTDLRIPFFLSQYR